MAVLYLQFHPLWESNDDVAMAMIAHGYGVAASGSPLLIFSNVIWGALVRAIPWIGGIQGYSLASLACLLASGTAVGYFLRRLGVPWMLIAPAVVIVLARPMLFPQFTINAGLLTLAAVLGWRVYARDGDFASLGAACGLAFMGFLVRVEEFALVLAAALPFLPWPALRRQRPLRLAVLLLATAVLAGVSIDRGAYAGPEWARFRALNPVRAQFTDFDAADRLLRDRPDIPKRHGLSDNDIRLLQNWFFVDSEIANPEILTSVLAELGPAAMDARGMQSGLAALMAAASPALLPLLAAAVVLFLTVPSMSTAISWSICIAALFTIGVMGRPGVIRIYVPLASLLLLAPLLDARVVGRVRRVVAAQVLIVAALANLWLLIPEAAASSQKAARVQADLRRLPADTIVVWGGYFPFEYAFAPLARSPQRTVPPLYGLGVSATAPFSVAYRDEAAGHLVVARLRSDAGVPIVASASQIELLGIYCAERLGGRLREIAADGPATMTIRRLQCRTTK